MSTTTPKSGSTGLIYGLNAIARYKRVGIGACIGVAVTAFWLYRHPAEHPLGATLGLILALGGGAGMAVERLLNYLAGWFVDPIRRYAAALWMGLIELFLVRRFAQRGILTSEEVGRLRNRAARRIVAGETRPQHSRFQDEPIHKRRPPTRPKPPADQPPDAPDIPFT